MKKERLKCKIFDKRLLNKILEEQINEFFNTNNDITIDYISKDQDSVIIVYKHIS
jgi:hypothetical protein